MARWRKIKSAPRDGSEILCAGPRLLSGSAAHGYWVDIGSFRAMQDDDPPEMIETWVDSGREPTHWQPLPKEPKGMG